MPNSAANWMEWVVGEVRERTTSAFKRADLVSISELIRPVVRMIRGKMETGSSSRRPASLSRVLCRPMSSAWKDDALPVAERRTMNAARFAIDLLGLQQLVHTGQQQVG